MDIGGYWAWSLCPQSLGHRGGCLKNSRGGRRYPCNNTVRHISLDKDSHPFGGLNDSTLAGAPLWFRRATTVATGLYSVGARGSSSAITDTMSKSGIGLESGALSS